MSDPTSMPAPPPSESYGRPARGPRPASIKTSINLIWAGVALAVLSTILTFVFLDDIVDQTIEAAGGASAITEDAARAGAVIGAVIGLVLGVVVNVVLAIFLGKGHNWARIVLTIFGALGLVFGLFGLTAAGSTPAALLVVSVLSLLVTAALLFFLWRKDSTAWLKG